MNSKQHSERVSCMLIKYAATVCPLVVTQCRRSWPWQTRIAGLRTFYFHTSPTPTAHGGAQARKITRPKKCKAYSHIGTHFWHAEIMPTHKRPPISLHMHTGAHRYSRHTHTQTHGHTRNFELPCDDLFRSFWRIFQNYVLILLQAQFKRSGDFGLQALWCCALTQSIETAGRVKRTGQDKEIDKAAWCGVCKQGIQTSWRVCLPSTLNLIYLGGTENGW